MLQLALLDFWDKGWKNAKHKVGTEKPSQEREAKTAKQGGKVNDQNVHQEIPEAS